MAEAATHFLRDGFDRTSIDRIAAGAKVSKQAIYELFRDKEDLFDQVVRAEMRVGFSDDLPRGDDIGAMVEAFALNLAEGFSTPRNYGLFRANIVVMRRFPELGAALHAFRRSNSRGLADYLGSMVAAGRIRNPGTSLLDLATRLGGMTTEGTRYFLGHDLPSGKRREAQARLAARLFCRGLDGASQDDIPDAHPRYVPEQTETPGKAQMRLSQDRFEGLCGAAADEFMEHGFEGASLDPIIAATGVGRTTIYRQFGNKQGLFAHVIGREIAALRTEIAPPGGSGLEGRLRQLCRAALDLHLMPKSIGLHHLLVQESTLFPELARSFYDMQVERLRLPFEQVLRSERHDAPSPAVARAFHTLATFGARYIATLAPPDSEERDAVSAQAARIMATGMVIPV